MPELPSGRCGQGGLKYVLTILAWKGPQRQGVELCSVSSCSIQASHRPSYTPGLLKHGQKWALLTALSAVPQIPAALSAQQLLPSQHSPSSCIAQGGIFCKWNCSPQLVCPAEAAGAAGISGKAGHQPGHGACWAEMNTQNSLVIEGRDLLGICNSLCGKGRLWDWMEVKTQNPFWGQELALCISHAFSCPWLVQDPCFYQNPSKQTVQSQGAPVPPAAPTHRTPGASRTRRGRWASWSPRDCWHSLGTGTGSLGTGPQWRGTCPKSRLLTAARPASLLDRGREEELRETLTVWAQGWGFLCPA